MHKLTKYNFEQDDEVEKLFETVSKEQHGKLDILVNNAFAAVKFMLQNGGKPFWETPAVDMWDIVNKVGLRNHYLCTVYASRYVNVFVLGKYILLKSLLSG